MQIEDNDLKEWLEKIYKSKLIESLKIINEHNVLKIEEYAEKLKLMSYEQWLEKGIEELQFKCRYLINVLDQTNNDLKYLKQSGYKDEWFEVKWRIQQIDKIVSDNKEGKNVI
jgi:hypothetical protein